MKPAPNTVRLPHLFGVLIFTTGGGKGCKAMHSAKALQGNMPSTRAYAANWQGVCT